MCFCSDGLLAVRTSEKKVWKTKQEEGSCAGNEGNYPLYLTNTKMTCEPSVLIGVSLLEIIE